MDCFVCRKRARGCLSIPKSLCFGFMEVRQECEHLSGCYSLRDISKQKTVLVQKLEAEKSIRQKQIVFRSDPGKFKKLKSECVQFIDFVTKSLGLTQTLKSMNIQELTEQVQNCQETITRFVERLSGEYAAYIDIVQPIQVALYEMKLGLALLISSALQKRFLDRVRLDDVDKVLGTIYSFMRFPRGYFPRAVSLVIDNRPAKLSSTDIEFPTDIGTVDTSLLETLLALSSDVDSDNMVSKSSDVDSDNMMSSVQLKAAILKNILIRVVHSVAETRFMDNLSFTLLDTIFDEFASLWMNMKVQVKTKEEHEAQQYKFRPREFKIDNIIQVDILTLSSSIGSDTFSEWQEMVSEEEFNKKTDEDSESLEEHWSFLQETVLDNMVIFHNALFGSEDLIKNPGSIQVSDSDRLSTFSESYTLGARMIKNLEGLLSSGLDAKLVPEHLLRLCVKHEQKFVLSHKTKHAYSFYKDSNAQVMVKMVEPLVTLQKRIIFLLKEWDDHPALQKILDVIEMVLTIPLSTPLSKALSALQFLLGRIRTLQETVSKFPITDQLEPVMVVVSSWQKLEFECWPTLLNDVQAQFEANAGKLWFPLYSVLQHRHSTNTDEYINSTIQSLKEFMETSSIGEFRKRLQLLFAFHGQTSAGIHRGCYSRILEHTEARRKSIELELKELLKLCRWERSDSYLSMEILKRTRQKLRKIIKEYTDSLEQPAMRFLAQETAQRGLPVQSPQLQNLLGDSFEMNSHILSVACDTIHFQDENRSLWLTTLRSKVDVALKNFHHGSAPIFDFPQVSMKDVKENVVRACVAFRIFWS